MTVCMVMCLRSVLTVRIHYEVWNVIEGSERVVQLADWTDKHTPMRLPSNTRLPPRKRYKTELFKTG